MTKWYTDRDGKPSTMRIIAMFAAVTGCGVMIAGMAGWFLGMADAPQMVGYGVATTGLGEIAKSWQASKGA